MWSDRKAIVIAGTLILGWVALALGAQRFKQSAADRERSEANRMESEISVRLKSYSETNGNYPDSLEKLGLDPNTTKQFRYWRNTNGGYSFVWEGKYGFRSGTFISESNRKQ